MRFTVYNKSGDSECIFENYLNILSNLQYQYFNVQFENFYSSKERKIH